MRLLRVAAACSLLACGLTAAAEPVPIKESWDYSIPMMKVAAKFTGQEGVVLHVGDSITYANPYSQWARYGKGKRPEDEAVCRWTHTGKKDDTDGWHLCSVDRPTGRSETAASGMRADQALAGGKGGLPALAELIRKYNPRMVVLMLGTNDATAKRDGKAYLADMTKAVELILANGTIPILSTIPPHPREGETARRFNAALRELAESRGLPLIDFEKEILARRPDDWNGTLLGKNDVHPTASQGGASASGEPTEENLKNSGYLLRGWLSVRKIGEVKARVLDNPLPVAVEGRDLTAEEKAALAEAERVRRETHEKKVKGALAAFKKAMGAAKSIGGRVAAVQALAAAGRDPKILAELARQGSRAESVRIAAMEGMAKYRRDPAAAKALLAWLPRHGRSVSMLTRTLDALRGVGHASAVPALARLVPERETRVAAAAIRALGETNAAAAVPPLLAHWAALEKDAAKSGDKKAAAEARLKEVEPALKEALQTLTGQAFEKAADAASWWAGNRRTFRPKPEAR
jgi:lysophospholipase L1-like esterase